MSLVLPAAVTLCLFSLSALGTRTYVRRLACRLALPAERGLSGLQLAILILPFWLSALWQLSRHGISDSIPALTFQAGLLACAVTDVEREWLPDSLTGPLILLALFASPLPGYIITPVMVMTLCLLLLIALGLFFVPSVSSLLPGRGDIMLWLALSAWSGLAGNLLFLFSLVAGGLTLLLTRRDHTPLGPWMCLAGTGLIPVTTPAHQLLTRFIHTLLS
nr:prepilin peptidase [Klebsiella variicola]